MTKICCTNTKKIVDIPVLGMLYDVLSVSPWYEDLVITNATINSFMELNKLKVAANKCSKICIGEKCQNCLVLNVYEQQMKEAQTENYLGDTISENGKLHETIKYRKL